MVFTNEQKIKAVLNQYSAIVTTGPSTKAIVADDYDTVVQQILSVIQPNNDVPPQLNKHDVMCWREFKYEKPEPMQHIWVYASYFVVPETRKLTVDDLKNNWDGLYWMPVILPACT